MTTTNEVAWLFELELKPGCREQFDALMPEMLEATRSNEPGCLAYQFFASEDGTVIQAYERYVDSDAALAHMAGFGQKFASRFMELVNPRSFTVLGSPNDQLMDAIRPIGAVVHSPVDGFSK